MNCAWTAYLNILPFWMRKLVDKQGREILQETRMRIGIPVELITSQGSIWLETATCKEDIDFVINAVSHYSPWTSPTIHQGFITAQGGHRIGLCGSVSAGENGMHEISSLCIRVARDFPGISEKLGKLKGSTLILGPPGSGKTTLLRDLIRQKSDVGGYNISVLDERDELFPKWEGNFCFFTGIRTDILSDCDKTTGMNRLLRLMNPRVIAVDEITEEKDSRALLYAARCGVDLLTTAHARNFQEFSERPIYNQLWKANIFDNIVQMHSDQTWDVRGEAV